MYALKISFVLFSNFSIRAMNFNNICLSENVFETKTFLYPISNRQSRDWYNNEMSSCPLINWNEENVMFNERTRIL